ncbi:hypothetical protein R5W23_005668 [Gemmata sp. JC673]|uniref:Uncharacterized protein n=1 Tax=Gemmata algarum TaxID=2975278 RepID=A0ABU5EUA0_9BACT|nr:hypothetical protein [Gemmata algarum]MDY3558548.1 hypothetical protein [Gemmata algarum]
MWKGVCRGIGLVVGSLAVVRAFFASLARIDSADELDYLVDLDVVIGGAFAVALLLVVTPSLHRASAKWCAVVAALVVGVGVSGALVWHHEEQVRIRSMPPVPHPADE